MVVSEDTKQQIIELVDQMLYSLVEHEATMHRLKMDGYAILKAAGINHDTLSKKDAGDEQEFADIVYAWWL